MNTKMNSSLSRERILRILQEEKPLLSTRFGVERIALFGSYAADAANEQSDIDLVVHLNRPLGLNFFGLANYLEEKFGYPVDLITHHSLQQSVTNPRRARIAANIESSLLYV